MPRCQQMHPDVQWPKAFEGKYVTGHHGIRAYWDKAMERNTPVVEPVGFNERKDGSLEITVQQVVKDLQGNLLSHGMVKHFYTSQEGLLPRMDIERT